MINNAIFLPDNRFSRTKLKEDIYSRTADGTLRSHFIHHFKPKELRRKLFSRRNGYNAIGKKHKVKTLKSRIRKYHGTRDKVHKWGVYPPGYVVQQSGRRNNEIPSSEMDGVQHIFQDEGKSKKCYIVSDYCYVL